MSVKLIIIGLLAAATVTTAEDAATKKKVFTVKRCEGNCDCAATTQYTVGECEAKDDGKYWRVEECENGDASVALESFGSKGECTNPNTATEKQACATEGYIKAVCDENNKVKLSIDCSGSDCGTCKDIVLENGDTCYSYDGLNLHFKVKNPTVCENEDEDGTNAIELLQFTDDECESAANTESVELVKDECTPFVHKKATCESNQATIHKCYGKGKDQCTTCASVKDFSLKQYVAYNSKHYYIDGCPANAEDDITFKVFDQKPMIKVIHNTCTKESDSNIYIVGTCGYEAANTDNTDTYNGPTITVKSSCTGDQCTQCDDNAVEKYNADGKCHKKKKADTTSYKANCKELTVTTYTDEACSQGKQTTTYEKTCTAGRIAVCSTTNGNNDNNNGGNNNDNNNGGNNDNNNGNNTTKSDDNGEEGSNNSSDGNEGSSGGSSSTTNNTTDIGIDFAPARSVMAVSTIVMFIMCVLVILD